MSLRRIALGIAAIMLATAGMGCGSNTLDSGELHDKVSGACDVAHKALALVADPSGADQVRPFLNQSSAISNQMTRSLKSLKPPSDSKASYDLAVQLVGEQAAILSKGAKNLTLGGDPVIVMRSVADQTTEIAQRERVTWESLGIDACASR